MSIPRIVHYTIQWGRSRACIAILLLLEFHPSQKFVPWPLGQLVRGLALPTGWPMLVAGRTSWLIAMLWICKYATICTNSNNSCDCCRPVFVAGDHNQHYNTIEILFLDSSIMLILHSYVSNRPWINRYVSGYWIALPYIGNMIQKVFGFIDSESSGANQQSKLDDFSRIFRYLSDCT